MLSRNEIKEEIMMNPAQLEEIFSQYISNLGQWAHDGVISVDLNLLQDFGLLEDLQNDNDDPDDLTQYFHVIESVEKVTLFNEQFAIWIVPRLEDEIPTTYVLIALIAGSKPQLEIVFSTTGVYNTPKYVLKVLQHFLIDTLETEATLTAIEKNS